MSPRSTSTRSSSQCYHVNHRIYSLKTIIIFEVFAYFIQMNVEYKNVINIFTYYTTYKKIYFFLKNSATFSEKKIWSKVQKREVVMIMMLGMLVMMLLTLLMKMLLMRMKKVMIMMTVTWIGASKVLP